MHGATYRLVDAPCSPAPVQHPLPLLVGGGGERRTLRVAARYADAWHVWGTPDEFAHKSAVLDARCAEIERDPGELRRLTGDTVDADEPTDQLRDRLLAYATAGVDEFVIRDHRSEDLDTVLGVLDRVAETSSRSCRSARLAQGGLAEDQAAGVGVQVGLDAQRHGELRHRVAERQPGRHRHAERGQPLDHGLQRVRRRSRSRTRGRSRRRRRTSRSAAAG